VVTSSLPELDEAVRYSLLSGGKRIRPRLCLAAARCAGGDPVEALPAAAALELVHAFSLVHDDLPALDDDDQRRGRPTSHVRYGEAVAVLVGDALLNGALRLVSERLDAPPEVRLAVVLEITRGVAGMIDGQYLDVTADGLPDHGQLVRIHRLKTGALIEASTVCGALVAAAPDVAPYRALGAELGLLFQIVDDILDEGSEDEPSYVNTLGLEQSRVLAAQSHRRAAALLAGLHGDRSELEGLVEQIALRTA
jgi:geranylgeranyl diphosphate synthase type II